MNKVKVVGTQQKEGGFEFVVLVDGMEFVVGISDDYYHSLTKSIKSREELLINSFKFLLQRESKESILKKFNLQIIKKYFPEYEEVIKN